MPVVAVNETLSFKKRDTGGVKPKVKRVRDSEGNPTTISEVDADSPDFSAQLTAAFKRNVARARRETRQA